MSLVDFFKVSLLKPNQIWKIVENPLKSSKLAMVWLTLVMVFPGVVYMNGAFKQLEQDLVLIDEQLPPFSIEDEQLKTDRTTKGFIYRTDLLSFVFDPNGQLTTQERMQEANQQIPVFAFLKDGVYIDTAVSDQKVDYAQLTGLNKASFTQFVQMMKRSHLLTMSLFIVMYFLFNYLYLLIVLLIISGLVQLLTALFMRVIVRFPRKISWQLTVAAATLPIVVYTVFDLMGIHIIGPGEFLFFATSINWILGMRELFNKK